MGVAPRFDKSLRFKFNRDQSPIVQEVKREYGESLAKQVDVTLTPNEWRKAMGLPPWPADVGDVVRRPLMESVLSVPSPEPVKRGRALDDAAAGFAQFVRALAAPAPKRAEAVNGRLPVVRTIYWRSFATTSERFEDRYAREFGKLFKALRLALIDSAKTHWETSKAVPYDRAEFDKEARAARMRLLPAVWREGSKMGAGEVDDVTGKKAARPGNVRELSSAAMEKIAERAENWTQLTGDETFRQVDELLRVGVNKGWNLTEMIDALEKLPAVNTARAERIARTEVIGSLNGGKLDGYAEMGVERKEWLATQDDRARDEHAEADGQVVGIEDSFDVGGQRLAYPGDPTGDPGNIINCRCTVLPVVGSE